MTLTFFGGVLGVIIAVGISNLILLLIPSLPAQVPLWAILAGLFTSTNVRPEYAHIRCSYQALF